MPERPPVPSPLPSLSAFLTVGFNSTVRHLEALARKSTPGTLTSDPSLRQSAVVSDDLADMYEGTYRS